MYEFKKACEMETDKGTFEVIYPRLYSNIGSSNTKVGCIFEFATDFVYSLSQFLTRPPLTWGKIHAILQLRQESLNLAILPANNRYFIIVKLNLQKNSPPTTCSNLRFCYFTAALPHTGIMPSRLSQIMTFARVWAFDGVNVISSPLYSADCISTNLSPL